MAIAYLHSMDLAKPGQGSVKLRLTEPFPGADHAVADGGRACPACGKPVAVQGRNMRPSLDDRAWESDAHCASCGVRLGLIRAEVDTLFGVREDRAVLHGRCRVY